jgi:hypothetical protein
VTTYTLDVAGSSTGNYAANAFANFTSPATTIFTSGAFKRIRPNPADDHLVAYTTPTAVDGEISIFKPGSVNFAILLRMTADRAIYYVENGTNVRIGVLTGFDKTAANFETNGTRNDVYVSSTPATDLPDWSSLVTDVSTITFGCTGFEVYLEYNGTEVLRFTQWQHVTAGNFGVWANDSGGTGNIIADLPGDITLYSDPDTDYYDPRDFGMKDLDPCTGSISATSSSLVLSSNPGFEVGDTVIVEIGTESGLGVRGTEGVGGHWPPLDYANAAAMNADTSQPNQTFAATLDDGFVYGCTGGVWSRSTTGAGVHSQGYYSCLMVPKALVAVVTNVSGNTLTLDTAASATATNANVWLDCLPSFYVIDTNETNRTDTQDTDGLGVPYSLLAPNDGIVFEIPAGRYATSDIMSCGVIDYFFPNLIFRGQGIDQTEFFAPDGTMGAQWDFRYCDGLQVKDFKNTGNHGANGYGFDGSIGGAGSPVGSITCRDCNDLVVRNIESHETFSGAVIMEDCDDGWAYDCSTTITEPHRQYVGWQMQTANASGGGFQDCTITAAYMTKGFECFGGNTNDFINCNGTNIGFSCNSSNGWLFSDCNIVITDGALHPDHTAVFQDEAIFSISANAFGGTRTSRGMANCGVIQQGYANAGHYIFKAVQVFSNYPDLSITGGYPACPVGTGYGGYFEASDHDPAHVSSYGGIIMSNALRTTVTGIRVVGAAIVAPGHSSHYGNISLLGAGSSADSCVADAIHVV